MYPVIVLVVAVLFILCQIKHELMQLLTVWTFLLANIVFVITVIVHIIAH
jgi:ABC-type spermidine/putrescine transport system permease subunit II